MENQNTSPINVSEIMDGIREEIKEKGYSSDMLSFADVPSDSDSGDFSERFDADMLHGNIQYVNANHRVDPYRPISGNPVAVFFKKVIRKLVSFYVEPYAAEQSSLNANIAQAQTQIELYIQESRMHSTKELLEQTANFLIPIITFSIADAVIRYGIDKNFDNRKIFTSACVTEAFGIGVLLLLSPLLNFLPYTEGYVVLLVIYCITSGFRQIASQFVRARGLVRLFAMDGILATLTLFIFNVTFIAGFHLGVTGFLISVILSDLLSGLFLWGVAGLHRFFRLRYMDKKILRMMLQFSIPLIPSALLWLVTGFSDRLFVRYMSGPAGLVGETAAGIYGVSTKIPNLISTISTIFFQAWNMSAIEENDSKDRSRFYHRVFDAYQSFMFIASAGLIVFVRILSNILIDSNTYPEYATAFTYTPVLIVGVLMMCFNQFLSSVYSATQHTTHSFWTSLVAAVVNIVLNIILIHIWGIMGAAIATFASYFVCYCIRIVDARKYVPFPVNHAKFAANTAALFLLGIVVVEAPPMWILILTVGFIFMVLYNFSAVTQTLARLKRR